MRPGAMGPPGKGYRAAAGGTGVLCGAESRHGEIAEAPLVEGELGLHAGAGQLLGGGCIRLTAIRRRFASTRDCMHTGSPTTPTGVTP